MPLLSIVIPTRNRQYYCIEALKLMISFKNPDIEICIQDNSDDDQVRLFVDALVDKSMIKYNYDAEQINSLLNMDKAISMASGEFICMIGDDDIVFPYIYDLTVWMKRNQIETLSSDVIVNYYWPGALLFTPKGILKYPHFTGQVVINNDIEGTLDKLFNNGLIKYLDYNLPKLYHGIVSKFVLEKIKSKTGTYLGGLSPDIYSCVSISTMITKHVSIDLPLSVAGACKKSTTAQSINGGHRGDLTTCPHLYKRGAYIWHEMIPAYYSVETIWAESALKAAHDMGKRVLIDKFNVNLFISYSTLVNHTIFKYICKCLKPTKYKYLSLYSVFLIPFNICDLIFKRALKKLRGSANQIETVHESVDNISDVLSIIGTQDDLLTNITNYTIDGKH